MQVHVNGEAREIALDATISALLATAAAVALHFIR